MPGFLPIHYSLFIRMKTTEAFQEHTLLREVSGCFAY